MRRTLMHRFAALSWMIAVAIGLIFVGLEYGVRFEIEGADTPEYPSWLDLSLLLCSYLFVFCLRPIQGRIQRTLCRRATRRASPGRAR